MQTYHEWMKGTLLITMYGCPALAAPAGFNDQGLPMGIQIVGRNRHELDCLQLAYAYEAAIGPGKTRLPFLLNTTDPARPRPCSSPRASAVGPVTAGGRPIRRRLSLIGP
jgi:hypothetical protein